MIRPDSASIPNANGVVAFPSQFIREPTRICFCDLTPMVAGKASILPRNLSRKLRKFVRFYRKPQFVS